MSYALEFYNLSWTALRSALRQSKPELIATLRDQQWSRLLEDCDLGHRTPHGFVHRARLLLLHQADDERGPWENVDAAIARGLEEIALTMAERALEREPVEVSDGAALVMAALVRQLGRPVGAIRQLTSVIADRGRAIDFREMFLNGVVGSCFSDHRLGENLAARPLFGLFHLDFVSWGGLSRNEIEGALAKYRLDDAERQDEEWEAIAGNAEAWLGEVARALRAAAAAQSDLVTLYLTVQKDFTAFGEELDDELAEDFAEFGEGLEDHFASKNGA